jgi:hypothetical protein
MVAAKKKQSIKKAPVERSFVRTPDEHPFVSFHITQQTFYWLVLGALFLGLGLWVIYLTIQVHSMYDTTDMTNANSSTTYPLVHRK